MAVLHLRKLLSPDSDDHKKPDSDDFSYTCDIEDCPIPPPQTVPHHRVPPVLIVMLCLLAAALLILSYLTVWRYRNSRRRGNPVVTAVEADLESGADDDEDRHSDQEPIVDHHVWYIRTVGFPQSVIDSISVFRYKRGEGLIDGSDCSVCLNEFEEDERLRLLPKCSHAFHLPCIDTWLRAHKNCPVCRAPIMAPNIPGDSIDSSRPGLVNEASNETESGQELSTGDQSREIRVGPGNGQTIPIQGDVVKSRNPGDRDFRVLSDLADNRVGIDQELQAVRRSASLDFSTVHRAMASKEGFAEKTAGKNPSGVYKMIKSASFGRTLQKGSVSMKRSFSFNGKRSVRKNNEKSHGSVSITICE